MPVSGLVLTFFGSREDLQSSMDQLHAAPQIELGEQNGAKLAIVVDSYSRQQDQATWQWVQELPGVAMIEVAFVGFEEESLEPSGPPPTRVTTGASRQFGSKDHR